MSDTGHSLSHYQRPDVPRFSRAERDGRWARVRELMKRERLDAILALNNTAAWDQANSNARYLSCIGGNCAPVSVVFPLEGDVTAVTGPVPLPDYWRQFQDWVEDIRMTFFNATPVIADRLRELKLERGRIGIAGLHGVAREPDGVVTHGAFALLREQLPKAELLNATFLMYEARVVKSAEEIAMLTRAARMVEGAFEVLDQEARAAVPEQVVYARMVARLIEQGSEPNTLLLWSAGNPAPPGLAMLPSARRLEASDMVFVEVDARCAGYLGHGAMTKWVSNADETARAMAALQFDAMQRCMQAMRPGNRLADVVDACADLEVGTQFVCKPIVHSRGVGLDAPVLVYHARDEWTKNWRIPENSVFVVKPVVSTRDETRRLMWGDSVVVKPEGARRLGTRPAPIVG